MNTERNAARHTNKHPHNFITHYEYYPYSTYPFLACRSLPQHSFHPSAYILEIVEFILQFEIEQFLDFEFCILLLAGLESRDGCFKEELVVDVLLSEIFPEELFEHSN